MVAVIERDLVTSEAWSGRRSSIALFRLCAMLHGDIEAAILPGMILTFHEGACVRAQAGDTTLVFGPVSKNSKNFKPTNFGADVAFVSFNNADMNGSEEAGRGDKQPFVIS